MDQFIPVETITNKILLIRDQKVLLDRDLAELYGVETGQLKKAVRGNIERFPQDFMFELSKKELEDLRCQIGTSSWGGIRYSPMAFTEQGVAMLSSVLNSQRAAIRSTLPSCGLRQNARTSVRNKKFAQKLEKLEERLAEHDENFQVVFEAIRQLLNEDEKPKRKIGF